MVLSTLAQYDDLGRLATTLSEGAEPGELFTCHHVLCYFFNLPKCTYMHNTVAKINIM
jgi:hypothetical protein